MIIRGRPCETRYLNSTQDFWGALGFYCSLLNRGCFRQWRSSYFWSHNIRFWFQNSVFRYDWLVRAFLDFPLRVIRSCYLQLRRVRSSHRRTGNDPNRMRPIKPLFLGAQLSGAREWSIPVLFWSTHTHPISIVLYSHLPIIRVSLLFRTVTWDLVYLFRIFMCSVLESFYHPYYH